MRAEKSAEEIVVSKIGINLATNLDLRNYLISDCFQGRSFALNIGAAKKYWDGRKGYFFGKSGFYCIFM